MLINSNIDITASLSIYSSASPVVCPKCQVAVAGQKTKKPLLQGDLNVLLKAPSPSLSVFSNTSPLSSFRTSAMWGRGHFVEDYLQYDDVSVAITIVILKDCDRVMGTN